jgi:hypothetical protein
MAGTSRVNREVYARFCGRLVVKFHLPTRQTAECSSAAVTVTAMEIGEMGRGVGLTQNWGEAG